MRHPSIVLTSLLSTMITLAVLGIFAIAYSVAGAAPTFQNGSYFVSVSGLAFNPVNQSTLYRKNVDRQLLMLNSPTRDFGGVPNVFIAPLSLPHGSEIFGLTLYGDDFDAEGEVTVRLKRCEHGNARCDTLATAGSALTYASGVFESPSVGVLGNTLVDNNLYSYFLELTLTALSDSGLRAVKLSVSQPTASVAQPSEAMAWELSGSVTNFSIPNNTYRQVEVCGDNLGTLPNATHYPDVIVDGRIFQLSPSQNCLVAWGLNIEIRRSLNTSASSGTYRFLN